MYLLLFVWCVAAMGLGCASAPIDEAAATPVPVPQAQQTRVIAQLRVAATNNEAEKRAVIVQAREGLLRDLVSTPHRVTRVYDAIPFVALEVSAEALRIAETSAWVERIQPDTLSVPQ